MVGERGPASVVSGPGHPMLTLNLTLTYPNPHPNPHPNPNPSQEVHGLCSLCWGVQEQLCR